MDNGFVRLPRHLFTSAAFKSPRVFSTFEAYVDLLQLAQWRSYQYFRKGRYVSLDPGDIITTSSRLAARWGWSREAVRVWLRQLADRRVLSGVVVEGLLKISLDPYCNSHFAQIPAEANTAAPCTGGKGGDSSSSVEERNSSSVSSSSVMEKHEEDKTEELSKNSSEEKKDDSSVLTSSDTEELKKTEQKTREDFLYSVLSSEGDKKVSPDTRARAAGPIAENSARLAELRAICEPPVTTRTEFPPGFPMEEFRRFLDDALLNPDKNRKPQVHAGWLAEWRDKFIAEKTEKETAAPESAQPEEKQAA